jgi:hypothetical protein
MRRRIVIVGNGELSGASAAEIDAADYVIRFNDCRSFGAGGTRTDVVAVCNTGRPAKEMLGSPAWRTHPAVVSAQEICGVRDPRKFRDMRASLSISHPELDDFCDDYTSGFNAFCKQAGKKNRVVEKLIHEGVDRALSQFSPPPYVVPSSGMIVIADMMASNGDADIAITGFGHAGWAWHPFAAERLLVDSYIAKGLLRRLSDEPASAVAPATSDV